MVNLIVQDDDQSLSIANRDKSIRKPSMSDSYVLRSVDPVNLIEKDQDIGELQH